MNEWVILDKETGELIVASLKFTHTGSDFISIQNANYSLQCYLSEDSSVNPERFEILSLL